MNPNPLPPPVVGQTVWSLNVGNAARHREQKLTPTVVRKVGRKYFECSPETSPNWRTTFHLDTWREKTDYCVDQNLYASPQDWEDERERYETSRLIGKAFDTWSNKRFTLPQLRAAKEALGL